MKMYEAGNKNACHGAGLRGAFFPTCKISSSGVEMALPARITTLTDATGARYAVREDRPPPQTFGKGAWFIMFDEAALEIAKTLDSVAAWKVLVVLPRHLDWSSWKPLRQQDLADELGLSIASVSRALGELVELKLVLRKGKGTGIRWKLPAEWGFKGTPGQFHAVKGTQAAERLTPPNDPNVAEGIARKREQRALTLLRSVEVPNKSKALTSQK